MTTTTMDRPCAEFNFIFIRQVKITKVFTRSVRVKYVVCSPIKVVLNLIELLIDSWTLSPFFAAKKIYEELDINNVLKIKARFIFFDCQNHNINGGIDAFV